MRLMRDGSASSNNASSKLDEVYPGSEVYSEHSAHIQLKLSLVPLQVATYSSAFLISCTFHIHSSRLGCVHVSSKLGAII